MQRWPGNYSKDPLKGHLQADFWRCVTIVDGFSEQLFLELVDAVLQTAGRSALNPTLKSIIRVYPDDQVLQIVAGPGSGKTEMLTWRILYEIFVRGVKSERILVTTFTRKAATELSLRIVERTDSLLQQARDRGLSISDPHVHDIRIGTLHSLCDSLLSEFDSDYMSNGTEVIDELEARIRLLRILRHRDFSEIVGQVIDNQLLVGLFRSPWERDTSWPRTAMDRALLIEQVLAHHTETWLPRCGPELILNGIEQVHGESGLTEDLIKLQKKWEEYLDKNHVIDFITLQKRFLERQEQLFDTLEHVFVDEFQDTNPIQYEIYTQWIKSGKIRLTVVGDDDQSIYRFRGSDIQCFMGLEQDCRKLNVNYRREDLEVNMRSTQSIVHFTQAFKRKSSLSETSMVKRIYPSATSPSGESPRLLIGPWDSLCTYVASEIFQLSETYQLDLSSFAILMFSTSERNDGHAKKLRQNLEQNGLRVYNPRNKTATEAGSPLAELMGLISYLIDPITKEPVGRNGSRVEVYASHKEEARAQHAKTRRPRYRSAAHIAFQKWLLKTGGGKIGSPSDEIRPLLEFVDTIREKIVEAYEAGKKPRLTIAGFVSRLLSFARYRNVGFSVDLLREALFTSVLESNISPSRMTKTPLDNPISVERDEDGKYVWPDQFWDLVNTMATLLHNTKLDDPEIESFADGAIQLLTFHQSKGLEFSHVYVALTGRNIQVSNVLRTMYFSGQTPQSSISEDGDISTDDSKVLQLATADRDREVYVALTRAKKSLTILFDPDDQSPFGKLNPALEALFSEATIVQREDWPDIEERRFQS